MARIPAHGVGHAAGVVSFASQIPILFLGPFAGVWVDRLNRHRVLVVTQTLSMLQSFGLAVLALAHVISVPEIIALNLLQGAVNAFDMPARQSFVIEMVENQDDLGNAIALNSSLVNAARLIGPSVAGLLIAAVGEGYCFLIDGFSYMAVIGSLLAMVLKPRARERSRASVLAELVEGWHYARGFRPIWTILLLLSLISLVGMPYTKLMPIFAGRILHGGAHTLGFLMAAVGVGALAGAITLAARRTVLGLGRVLTMTSAGFGLGLSVCRIAMDVALDVVAGADRFLLHATDGVEPYDSADHRRGQETRTSDEFLFDGDPGSRAVWKPGGGRRGKPHGRPANIDDRRCAVRCGCRIVRLATAEPAKADTSDLRSYGDHSRGGDRTTGGCDHAVTSAGMITSPVSRRA